MYIFFLINLFASYYKRKGISGLDCKIIRWKEIVKLLFSDFPFDTREIRNEAKLHGYLLVER